MSADLATALALLKVGDEVVVTVEDPGPAGTYSITGIVWEANHCLHVAGKKLRYPDGTRGYWIEDVVIKKPAPDPEPPIGSVVLDDEGDAWQSFRFGREAVWRSVGDDSVLSWERFTDIFGPVRVVYTPEGES